MQEYIMEKEHTTPTLSLSEKTKDGLILGNL